MTKLQNFPRLNAILRKLKDDDKFSIYDKIRIGDFVKMLTTSGGWRVLLDCYCAEWDQSNILTKYNYLMSIIHIVSLKELIGAFKDDYLEYGRPDIAYAADDAMKRIFPDWPDPSYSNEY